MNKKILIIVAILVVVGAGYLLIQEFKTSPAPQKAAEVEKPAQNVADAEKEQELKELVNDAQESTISKSYLVKCAPCHSKDGSGPVGAVIKGMTKDELMQSLLAYKNNKVPNSMMKGILNNTTEKELEMLADEISKF